MEIGTRIGTEEFELASRISAVLTYQGVYFTFGYSFLLQIAEKLFDIIKQQHLKDVGQLEQDLVFGDAGSKELIDFFRTHQVIINWTTTNKMLVLILSRYHTDMFEDLIQDISRENKLRLLMIYAAINPEKIQSEKGAKLMQVTLVIYWES